MLEPCHAYSFQLSTGILTLLPGSSRQRSERRGLLAGYLVPLLRAEEWRRVVRPEGAVLLPGAEVQVVGALVRVPVQPVRERERDAPAHLSCHASSPMAIAYPSLSNASLLAGLTICLKTQ